jgi:hypothetical protein
VIYALEQKTGELAWKFAPMTPWGNETHPSVNEMPTLKFVFADGKLYTLAITRKGTSTGSQPSRSGGHGLIRFVCLDASTGALIWDTNGWFDAYLPSIADGNLYGYDDIISRSPFMCDYKYFTGIGAYIYCIGMGPTEFSELSVDQASVTVGETVTISGQLLDISPGFVGPPPITPVTSGPPYYLKSGPPDHDGVHAANVPVNITYVGSDGVRRPIAYVKTDSEGRFSYEWTPYVEGGIQIRADSVGSDAFYAPENAYVPLVVTSALDLVPILEAALVAAIVVAVALPVIVYLRMRKSR